MEFLKKNKSEIILISIFVGLIIIGVFSKASSNELVLSDVSPLDLGNSDLTLKTQSRESTVNSEIYRKGNNRELIATLRIEGQIQGGQPTLFNGLTYDHSLVLDSIEALKNTNNLKALVLELNTPGGSVYETLEVYTRLLELKEEKQIPIYAVMKGTCASGGVYMAMAADKIYASPETMTGSIGVIFSGTNYEELYDKLGIEPIVIKSGEHKDIMSSAREMTDEERQILQEYVDESFNRFVEVVMTGRDMSREEVLEIATGRIFTGTQAQELGLVDEIGFFDDALDEISEELELENPTVARLFNSRGFSPFSNSLSKDLQSYIGEVVNNTVKSYFETNAVGGLNER